MGCSDHTSAHTATNNIIARGNEKLSKHHIYGSSLLLLSWHKRRTYHREEGRSFLLSGKKERRGRDKLSIITFGAGVGGWISVIFLTARGFFAEFLVLLSKPIVSKFHNLQQHSHSEGRDRLLLSILPLTHIEKP